MKKIFAYCTSKKNLCSAREDMRSVTEDQEAANEELQSANEELLSGSEELQSLNEELETSKEEIQSTNEELTIMNQELHERNDQLNVARHYSEAIIKTLREPLIILDQQLRIKTANNAFYEKFQVTDLETEGKLIYELGNNQWDIAPLRKLLQQIISGKTTIENFEITHNFPSIGERSVLLNARQVVNEKNVVQLILLAIEDITEKKLLEKKIQEHAKQQELFAEELERQVLSRTQSLKEANIELEHSNKNQEQFASIASHDLQEPLRKIQTFALLLQQRHSTEIPIEAKELINKISSAAARMSVLIKDVLNFSRMAHEENRFVSLDLNVILDNVLKDFDLLIFEKKAVVTIGELSTIEGIPLQINQLFYNLLSNALKFSNENIPPVIRISSRLMSPEEIEKYPDLNSDLPFCEIIFEDNGIGFDQQFAEQIFLIFQRLNTRQQFAGTGIGLALCQKIVVNHHGEIRAESKENEGTKFYIFLPLKQSGTLVDI